MFYKIQLLGMKFAETRLPAVVYQHYSKYMGGHIVLQGLVENDLLSNHFLDLRRGREFEGEALSYFCDTSMSHATSCGFFNHPDDSSYGASPDGLVAPGSLLGINTRSANSDRPLLNIAKNPGYYIQAQIHFVLFYRINNKKKVRMVTDDDPFMGVTSNKEQKNLQNNGSNKGYT